MKDNNKIKLYYLNNKKYNKKNKKKIKLKKIT